MWYSPNMIIQSEQKNIEKSEGLQSQAFGIKANAQAFSILSSRLYSDKILAIIREWSCNAWDAHVAAGKESTPIEIHLPNSFEPHFSVKDFGTGLSHNDVMKLYSTYFESSKTNDNSQIGGLGLGSKSGFCYSESFMVVSRFNGEKRTYTAYLGEDGCPSISMLGEEVTDEGNGLEVSIAVKNSDFYTFKEKSERFFRRFPTTPVFKGVAGFVVTARNVNQDIKGADWHIDMDGGGAKAMMGVVAYPINNLDQSTLSEKARAVLGIPIEVKFGIGELEVAASREALSFTKPTIAAINSRFEAIYDEISSKISDMIATSKNKWAAMCLLREMTTKTFPALARFQQNVSFQGQPLKVSTMAIDKAICVANKYEKPSYRRRVTKYEVNDVYPVKDTEFFIKDIAKGSLGRIKEYAQNNTNRVIIVMEIVTGKNEADVLEMLGKEGDVIRRVSELPKPVHARGTITSKGKARALVLDIEGDYLDSSEYWNEVDEDFDFEEGGVYVPVERYKINDVKPGDFIKKNVNPFFVLDIDISDVEVIGLKSHLLEKARNHKKWVSFEDFAANKLREEIEKNKVAQVIANYAEYSEFTNKYSWIQNLVRRIDQAELTVINDEIIKVSMGNKNANLWFSCAQQYKVAIDKAVPEAKPAMTVKALIEKYPMLRIIERVREEYTWAMNVDCHLKEIAHYLGGKVI